MSEHPFEYAQWGIDQYHYDGLGVRRQITSETRDALVKAMGADPSAPSPPETADHVLLVRPGDSPRIPDGAELQFESGERLTIRETLPPNLPPGYHELQFDDGSRKLLIAPPSRCHLPPDLHTWGWALQLYSLRSQESWGMGDLADLREFAEWSARDVGAGVILVNPLGATNPGVPQEPSPYYPSSRRFRNPLYLRIEELPRACEMGDSLERLGVAGRMLNRNRLIDRDAIWRLKMDALEVLWERFGADAAFDAYCVREGPDLEKFAIFCVLSERHGRGWQHWPQDVRHPSGAAAARILQELRSRVRFHMWMQWHLDRQLARAAETVAVIQDFPVGVDPDGADAWLWQDALAEGISVGAPPDGFNTNGQDWGLPPFIPHKLRALGYLPLIQSLRASLRYAGGLRIDHVMGLFRLFWIPVGMGPRHGAYVRYNAEELLAIVAIESQRAKAFIVGEDLGTVEPGVREKLGERGILSYRLAWFEEGPPSQFPLDAVAAVSTHDLPTIAGVWTGTDLTAQKRIGVAPNEQAAIGMRSRLRQLTGLDESAGTEAVISKTYEALATAPSRIVTASLEDALGVEERPNFPATTSERWPNWSLALPLTAEQIRSNDLVRSVASAIAQGRSTKTPETV